MGRSVLCLLASLLPVAAQEQRFATLGDFKLENGEVIRDCRIGYRTFGRLNANRSNAILFPTWFTGKTADLAASFGPGKLVDTGKYYVIAVDALGDGVSSSPSNSTVQPRLRFPRFTIRDMVNSQHRVLTEELNISHLRAVMGISMGGMQTFQWAVSYPGFMDRAIPIVGTPQLTSYDLLLWNTEKRALDSSSDWRQGAYAKPPAEAMRTVAAIHALAISTPRNRVSETTRDRFPQYLQETERKVIEGFDASDWYRQLEAMIAHDVAAPFRGSLEAAARRVRARMLIVVALEDQMVNPRPSLEFARLLQAPTLELESDCGHLAPGCEEKHLAAKVESFLK